ncbi:hypothetical protein H4R99_006248 [Coemansia sp. RSA 1722]|nr:hypothetical protein IWW45_005668 [Coemansia sp. RSA 485]KAJ2592952.1 hypothetical protein H4R99_006248 [Coemansia sp. RSA 1722]
MHSAILPKLLLQRKAASARRLLWVAASSTSSSLDAAISECADSIKATLAKRTAAKKRAQTHDSCFALVSQSFSAADVETAAQRLQDRLSKATGVDVAITGAVVDRIATNTSCHGSSGLSDGVSVLYHRPEPGTCSDAGLEAKPFYIGDMHGRQRLREVAVGRWHNTTTDRFRDYQRLIQWKDGQSSVTQAASHLKLPKELEEISDPSAVELILMAADKDSSQVFDALDSRFSRAVRLAIVGSQTPFFNGREFTLFGSNQVYESGVVGVAFVRSQGVSSDNSRAVEQPQVAYTGLRAISDVLEIRRSKGNVVLEVENGEAAHQLIASIRKQRKSLSSDRSSENRLFAKITPSKESMLNSGVVLQVTGGDPAKGGLAIDTTKDIEPGRFIQFMMLEDSSAASLPESTDQPTLRFTAKEYSGMAEPACTDAGTSIATNVFGGATEGGFVYSISSTGSKSNTIKSVLSGSAECAVPGSSMLFTLDN